MKIISHVIRSVIKIINKVFSEKNKNKFSIIKMSTSRSNYNIQAAKQNSWMSLRYEEMARSEMKRLLQDLTNVLDFIENEYYSPRELNELLNLINETQDVISQRLNTQ